jgi:hypothetical protein
LPVPPGFPVPTVVTACGDSVTAVPGALEVVVVAPAGDGCVVFVGVVVRGRVFLDGVDFVLAGPAAPAGARLLPAETGSEDRPMC